MTSLSSPWCLRRMWAYGSSLYSHLMMMFRSSRHVFRYFYPKREAPWWRLRLTAATVRLLCLGYVSTYTKVYESVYAQWAWVCIAMHYLKGLLALGCETPPKRLGVKTRGAPTPGLPGTPKKRARALEFCREACAREARASKSTRAHVLDMCLVPLREFNSNQACKCVFVHCVDRCGELHV